MTDHQLSTRDLATRSDSDEVDSSLENQQPTYRTTGATGDQDAGFDSSETDASLMRDPDASQPAGTRAADGGTNTAAGAGEPVGSVSGQTRAQEAPGAGTG